MSQTFHSKYHRANHMTLKNPNLPDAGWDPIASETVPFSGDFYMATEGSTETLSGRDSYGIHTSYLYPANGKNDVTVDSPFKVNGHTFLYDNLDVYGQRTYLDRNLEVKGRTDISGDFYVWGPAAWIMHYLGVSGYEYIIGKDNDNYGLKVTNKIYASGLDINGGMNITGNVEIDGNCYVTQEVTASTGEFKEASAQSATADFLYAKLLSAVSATFHNIDITATEASGFVITGERPAPSNYYEIPNPLPVSAHSNLWLDKAGLMVDGWAILSGDVKMERKLGVSGDVTLSGDTSVNTLNATGAVDFDSTLNVDGATTLKSLAVTNNATVGGTLGVTGATTLSALTATGNCEFTGLMKTAGINALGNISANGIYVKGGHNLEFMGGGNIIMDGGAISISKDGFVMLQRTSGPQYPPNFIVLELDSQGSSVGQYNILLPIANGTVALQASIAPTFSDSETYAVGDYVVHEGLLYKCATAVETSGSWTGNTNWTEATVTDEMATVGYVDSKIGDINSVLDAINGEVI